MEHGGTITNKSCPDITSLAGYARNDLPLDEVTPIEAHLPTCPTCLERYVELGKRSFMPEIRDCHVIKEIGRGRFGVVYKAWSLKDEPKIVALKVLSYPGEMEKSRFDREIAVLKKLDSPWIVKCFDSGTTSDAMYYIMEYVEGVHLDEYFDKTAPDLIVKLDVFQRVCRAVAAAHAEGVVHRDLKPRNILIDKNGDPHILDFGICAVESPDWTSWAKGTLTHMGDVIGTLRYMSPEQAWGGVSGPVDERSDIWSLGIMLYEMVTGGDYPYEMEPTPEKPAHEALLDRIRKELPHIPRLDFMERGRDMEILLDRSLSWEPDQRIESASLLADDLERYAEGKRIKTKPLWLPYRLKRLAVGAVTHKRWMFSAGFVAVLGVSLWLATFVFKVGWRVSGHELLKERQTSASSVAAAPDDEVLIVAFKDETVDAVLEFAKRRGMSDVTTDIRTWRELHGNLMQRLAKIGPIGLVWDAYFPTAQLGDEKFLAGIETMEEAGVPVILVSLTYQADGTPDLSPIMKERLGKRLRHGVAVARYMVARPGEFIMAIKRSNQTILPSMALTTLAAILHPQAQLDLDWRGRERAITLLYKIRPGAYLRARDRLAVSKVFKHPRTESSVSDGDMLACMTFELERPEYWARRTVAYEDVLRCSEDELRAWAAGKLVIVGDLRTRAAGFVPDRHPVKFGTKVVEDVPGCFLLANAVSGLLNGEFVEAAFPPRPITFLIMLVLATMGCVLPIRITTRRAFDRAINRQLLWIAVITTAACGFAVMVLSSSYVAVHLGMACFAMATPMTGSCWVEFARNRHRIVDRSQRGLQSLSLSTAGTLTLPQKQQTSFREAR